MPVAAVRREGRCQLRRFIINGELATHPKLDLQICHPQKEAGHMPGSAALPGQLANSTATPA